jgi:hypothetical protein
MSDFAEENTDVDVEEFAAYINAHELEDLEQLDEIYTRVEVALRSRRKDLLCDGPAMDTNIFVADVPHHVSLQQLLERFLESVREKCLHLKVINCHPGQAHFAHFQTVMSDIIRIESDGSLSPITADADRTLCDADFVIVDNANMLSEFNWQRFLQITKLIKQQQDDPGLPIFLLIGSNKSSSFAPGTLRVTQRDALPTATYLESSYEKESVSSLAEAHFSSMLDRMYLDTQCYSTVENPGCHVDNYLRIETNSHLVTSSVERLLTRAKMQFSKPGEVLLLSCFEIPSLNFAENTLCIWDLLANQNERASPDFSPDTTSYKISRKAEK